MFDGAVSRERPAPPHRVRALAQAGVLAGVAAALGIIFLPLLGPLTLYLIAQPLVVLTVRRGARTGAAAGAAASAVLSLVYGPLVGVPVGVMAAATGVGLGWGIARGLTAVRTVILAGLVVAGATVLLTAATTLALRLDPFEALARPMAASLRMSAGLFDRTVAWLEAAAPATDAVSRWLLGETQALAASYRDLADHAANLLRQLLPTLLLGLVVVPTSLAYAIARAVLVRMGHTVAAFPPVLTWRVSKGTAGAVMVAMLVLLGVRYVTMGRGPENAPMGVLSAQAWLLALNGFGVLQLVFTVQALLVLLVLLKKRGLSVWFRAAAGLFVVQLVQFVPLLGFLTMYVGLLDSWYDFRRLSGGQLA